MKKLIAYLLFLVSSKALPQNGSNVFNDTIVHVVKVEINLLNWFDTLENDFDLNFANPEVYPEVYRKCDVWFDGVKISNCGFREKGNASNSIANFGRKKPYKIAFDEFANQTHDGLKKINLNNFTNDPSLLHDAICNKLFRDEGIPAPRTSYARFFVNEEYIGLYVVIENVDKTFLKSHYGSANNDGNLYKTDRGAQMFLKWLGSDKEAYKQKKFKLNTNETIDDWTKFIELVNLINNDYSPEFRQKFEKSFDVHTYLKVLAIEKCVRSWDSYWGGGNNFYMYEHPDGKFRWIPWDMNETFQDIKILSGTSLLNGYLIPTPQIDERPLIKRIFEYEDWKQEYLNYACDLISSKFNLNHLGPYALKRHKLIDSSYKTDPYRYNSYEDFSKSLTETNKDEVSLTKSSFVLRLRYPGIFPFIEDQRKWVVDQLKGWDKECAVELSSLYTINIYPNPCADNVKILNENKGFEYARFVVFDFTGKKVMQTDYDLIIGNDYELNVSQLPSGIYLLLQQSSGGKLGRAKLIKQ